MRRTNLVLDEDLLAEAKREMGLKTYSATVNAVLKEAVRRIRVRKLADYVGKVEWIGDLSQMRDDNPRRRPRAPNERSHGYSDFRL
jgi:Arc/MetJ family transcription regulator